MNKETLKSCDWISPNPTIARFLPNGHSTSFSNIFIWLMFYNAFLKTFLTSGSISWL